MAYICDAFSGNTGLGIMFYSLSDREVNNMNVEIIIIIAVIALSSAFLVRRFIKTVKGKESGCCSCGSGKKSCKKGMREA
jgi:hypothetical protein